MFVPGKVVKPGTNVMKLCTSVIYKCSLKDRVFVHAMKFQPSVCSRVRPELTRVPGSWPYPHTLDNAGKAQNTLAYYKH